MPKTIIPNQILIDFEKVEPKLYRLTTMELEPNRPIHEPHIILPNGFETRYPTWTVSMCYATVPNNVQVGDLGNVVSQTGASENKHWRTTLRYTVHKYHLACVLHVYRNSDVILVYDAKFGEYYINAHDCLQRGDLLLLENDGDGYQPSIKCNITEKLLKFQHYNHMRKTL